VLGLVKSCAPVLLSLRVNCNLRPFLPLSDLIWSRLMLTPLPPPVFDQVETAGSLLCILDGFSTAAVPQCISASGQVRYEVTLLDMGRCPQIGWATPSFGHTHERTGDGTGDDEHSWAADGARQSAWHGGQRPGYDVAWATDDVIGVAADLDVGSLSFAKNGEWLEVFSGIDISLAASFRPLRCTMAAARSTWAQRRSSSRAPRLATCR
jgi:hypothetical protein